MKGRKLLSAFIAGAMVLGTMSLPAFAASELPAAVGGVITLTEDVTLANQLTITADTTINLAGFNITSADVAGSEATLKTLIDVQGATLTINGAGTIEPGSRTNITNYSSNFYTISASNGATVIIDGATVKGSKGINTKYGGTAVNASRANVTIQNGAKIYGGDCEKNGVTSENYQDFTYKYQGEAGDAVYAWNSPLSITGSEIYGGNGMAATDTQRGYISGGANFAQGGLGISAVQPDTVAVVSNSTVKGGDSTLYNAENAVYVGFGAKLTVEGCTITGGSCLVQNGYGIAGAGISVPMDECEVTVTASNVTGGSTDDSWIGSGIDVAGNADGSTIKVESSEIAAGSGAGNASSAYAIETGTPISVELKDTTLKANADNGNAVSPATGSVTAEGTLTVEGGALNTEVFTNGGVTVSGDETVTPQIIAAKIGDTMYSSIQAAIDAATNGAVIYVYPVAGGHDAFTIDKPLTIEGIPDESGNNPVVTINVTTYGGVKYNAAVTLKNLDFVIDENATGSTWCQSAVGYYYENVRDRNNSSFINCNFVNNSSLNLMAIFACYPTLTVTGCTFTNFDTAIATMLDGTALENTAITGNTFDEVDTLYTGYWGRPSDSSNIEFTGNTVNSAKSDDAVPQILIWDYSFELENGLGVANIAIDNTYNTPTEFVASNISSGSNITKDDNVTMIKTFRTADVASRAGTLEEGEEFYLNYGSPSNEMKATYSAEGITLYEANTITVKFEETDEDGVYDIKLNGNGNNIYEFVGAEFTFANTSATAGGSLMAYEVSGISGQTEAAKDLTVPDKYAISLAAGAERMSGTEMTIGQVKFIGQGTINFAVNGGTVVATKYNTHDENDYSAANDNLEYGTGIVNGSMEAAVRNVAVNVDFVHDIDGTVWTDNQMTATLKDAFGDITTKALSITNNAGTATFENIPVGRITVILEAPGFRKYTYTTIVEEGADPLVLSFWNDTKRDTIQSPLKAIEAGKAKIANNFVVGDIAMDYMVDKYDLAAVTSYYGTYGLTDESKIKYDLNRDGNIDITDVAYVLHNFGF